MAKKLLSRSRPREAAPAKQTKADRGWTRRPLHRIYEIHTWVKAGRYPNCQQLAKALEMTAKTVQRDINFMRDELNLPLAWYLFGFDLDRGAVRSFALPRITDLEVTTTPFERPADFSLRHHLGGSFGVWNYPEDEAGDQDVRVVFRGYAARVVAERRWHPSQEIAPVPAEEGGD